MPRARQRTRRLAITLVCVGFPLAALFVLSLGYRFGVHWPQCEVACGAGMVTLFVVEPNEKLAPPHNSFGPLFIDRQPVAPEWWFEFGRMSGVFTRVVVPLWIPTVLLLAPGLYLLYRTRTPGHFQSTLRRLTQRRTRSRWGVVSLALAGLGVAAMIPVSIRGVLLDDRHVLVWGCGVFGAMWQDERTGRSNSYRREVEKGAHVGPFFAVGTVEARRWWFQWDLSGTFPRVVCPLWTPILLFTLAGSWLCYRSRYSVGHCRNCRYNLTGLPPNTPCPECGRPVSQ